MYTERRADAHDEEKGDAECFADGSRVAPEGLVVFAEQGNVQESKNCLESAKIRLDEAI